MLTWIALFLSPPLHDLAGTTPISRTCDAPREGRQSQGQRTQLPRQATTLHRVPAMLREAAVCLHPGRARHGGLHGCLRLEVQHL